MSLKTQFIHTKGVDNGSSYECANYAPLSDGKRCRYYAAGGKCNLPYVTTCIEWLKANGKNQSTTAETLTQDIVHTGHSQQFKLECPPGRVEGDLSAFENNAVSGIGDIDKTGELPPTAAGYAANGILGKMPLGAVGLAQGTVRQSQGLDTNTPPVRLLQGEVQLPQVHEASTPPVQLPQGTFKIPQGAVQLPPTAASPITQEDIDSFKQLGAEVCIETQAGPIWLVPRYTGENRIEFTPEHVAFLTMVRWTFPDATISRVKPIQPSNKEVPHGK